LVVLQSEPDGRKLLVVEHQGVMKYLALRGSNEYGNEFRGSVKEDEFLNR
jgi:hypothetical protein